MNLCPLKKCSYLLLITLSPLLFQSENVALKSSIEECTSTIQLFHSEMNGLKTIATSKLRMRENSPAEEHQKDRDVIKDMEKKLDNANNLIRSLQSSSSRYYESQGGTLSHLPPSINRLKTPEERQGARRSRTELLSREVDYYATPPGSAFNQRRFAAELSTEKELRYKAEEICAGVLANSKSAIEERDSEISKLRSKLFKLSSKSSY